MRRSLTRICMLKKRDDIKRVFSSRKYYSKSILIRYCSNGENESRFLVVPEKKAHGSVGRNLIRRRISEILRVNQYRIRSGLDIAFFVKRDVSELKHAQLSDLVMGIMGECGFLRS